VILQESLFEIEESTKLQSYRGGFPCQPHSNAGERKASTDERDMWPEYKRIIGETRPKWVVGENVPGILSSENGRFFGGILRDMAQLGYDVGWCSISASWLGALHRRERIFITANTNSNRIQRVQQQTIQRIAQIQSNQSIRSLEELSKRSLLFEPKLLRTLNGIPSGAHRIKAIGNTILPDQIYPIFQAIADIERSAT
jgi:DNA (cytosine-5)-methyltransferase 1